MYYPDRYPDGDNHEDPQNESDDIYEARHRLIGDIRWLKSADPSAARRQVGFMLDGRADDGYSDDAVDYVAAFYYFIAN